MLSYKVFLLKEDLSLNVISGELWLRFVSAFAITFRSINSAMSAENEHHINPLKKTKGPRLWMDSGFIFRECVGRPGGMDRLSLYGR